jgi:hypothetical protein
MSSGNYHDVPWIVWELIEDHKDVFTPADDQVSLVIVLL